jgi:2-methylcitrate dehydratase PrpD
MFNATAAHSFEYDDIHMGGMIHPGALALSAALACAEGNAVSGETLLTAMIAGCEVGARVGQAVGISHFRQGYHPQGTVGVFVASATAGRVMGLDATEMRDAIGIAGTQATGLMAAQEGSMMKRLHSGLASQSGVRSALLALEGFTGIDNVLEAEFGGFCSTMGGGNVHLEALTSQLGERWESDDIGFKPYASCAAAQSSIEVARLLREEMLAQGDVIESVTIRSSTHAQIHCGWEYHPGGITAAQMNIPYGVAAMLLYGEVTAAQFTDEAIVDPATMELARRIVVVPDESIDALGPDQRYTVHVALHTASGRILTGDAIDRPGGPTQPLSTSAIREKFDRLVTPILGETRTNEIAETVESIESLSDVDRLSEAFAAQ